MTRLPFISAPAIGVTALCLSLGACASLQGEGHAVLQNLQGCERHYSGVVAGGLAGGSFSGSVKIDCAPAGAAVAQ